MSTRLPKLGAKHPATLSQQVMRQHFIEYQTDHMLHRIGPKHFALMNR